MPPTDTPPRRRTAPAVIAACLTILAAGCTDGIDAVDSLTQPVHPVWTVQLDTVGTPNHTVGDRILTTAMDGESATRMVGLDLADGSEVWSRPIGAWNSDRALVLVDTEEGHRVLDVGPGRSQRINGTWEGEMGAWTVRTSAVDLLDPRDGELVTRHPVPDHGQVISVEWAGDHLYLLASVPTQPDPAGPVDGNWTLGTEVRGYLFDPHAATFSTAADLGLGDPWVPLGGSVALTWPENAPAPSVVSLRREDAGRSMTLPDPLSLTRDTLLTHAKAATRIPDSGQVAIGAADQTADGGVDVESFRTILLDLDSRSSVAGPLPGRPCGSREGAFLLCTGSGRTVEAAPGTHAVVPDLSGFRAVDASSGEELWSVEPTSLTRADAHASYADSSRFLTFTREGRLSVLHTGSGEISDLPEGTTALCSSRSTFSSDLSAHDRTQVPHHVTRHFPCGADLTEKPGAGWTLGMVEAGNWWTLEAGGGFAPLPDQDAANGAAAGSAAAVHPAAPPTGESGPAPGSPTAGPPGAPREGPGTVHLAVSHEENISLFRLAVE